MFEQKDSLRNSSFLRGGCPTSGLLVREEKSAIINPNALFKFALGYYPIPEKKHSLAYVAPLSDAEKQAAAQKCDSLEICEGIFEQILMNAHIYQRDKLLDKLRPHFVKK